MDDVWKSALAEIEIEVSKPIFQTFFKGTQLIKFESSIATISAPTHITADYIEKRYYALIKHVLDKKTGEKVSLVFTSHRLPQNKKNTDSGPLFAKELLAAAPAQRRPLRIRPDYTFETFAVSESNQLAYTAASTVASSLGGKYNPVYFYGTVGVGKTHLMHAVANKVFDEKRSDASILYMTTEEFTNEVVEAIRDKTTTQLRRKFRNVNLLLLDDIQFLSGKEKVQEELFHTFNSLIDKGSQIIFSSDRPPSEIKKIEARLASRFEGGLTVDIEPPDFELRTAILLIKSAKFSLALPLEIAKQIAEKITDSRALEGFLLRLSSVLSAKDTPSMSHELVSSLIRKPKDEPRTLHPDSVVDFVCDFYHIRSTQLKGAKRDSLLVKPRHVCMYLLKEEAGLTLVEIGNLLGGRDHTTVMHGVEKVRGLLSTSPKINEDIMLIKRGIKDSYLQ